jgi:thiamine biosynthesis protein ThiS
LISHPRRCKRLRCGNRAMITVNDKKKEWREGMTVTSLIKDARKIDPHFDSNGVVIILNNLSISKDEFDSTAIHDNDNIIFIVPLSGG